MDELILYSLIVWPFAHLTQHWLAAAVQDFKPSIPNPGKGIEPRTIWYKFYHGAITSSILMPVFSLGGKILQLCLANDVFLNHLCPVLDKYARKHIGLSLLKRTLIRSSVAQSHPFQGFLDVRPNRSLEAFPAVTHSSEIAFHQCSAERWGEHTSESTVVMYSFGASPSMKLTETSASVCRLAGEVWFHLERRKGEVWMRCPLLFLFSSYRLDEKQQWLPQHQAKEVMFGHTGSLKVALLSCVPNFLLFRRTPGRLGKLNNE